MPVGFNYNIEEIRQADGWRAIHDFWFPAGLADADLDTHRRIQPGGFAAERIQLAQFAPVVDAADRGDLGRWADEPLGRLSQIIVLDQFPRGLHAGTPRAFSSDPQALALTEEGLRNGHYDALSDYWQQVFLVLPLIHAEGPDHLERANRNVALAERRLTDGPEHLRPIREFGLAQRKGTVMSLRALAGIRTATKRWDGLPRPMRQPTLRRASSCIIVGRPPLELARRWRRVSNETASANPARFSCLVVPRASK